MARRVTTNVPVGVPDSKIVRLRYVTDQEFNPTFPGSVATAAVVVYSANGMYDPDVTHVGHQPLWFDQWMAMYNHFVVTECSIRVTFVSTGNAPPNANCIVGVHLDASSATTTTCFPPYYPEQSNTTWKCISNVYNGGPTTVVATADNAAFFRMSKAQYMTDNEFRGTASTNPTEGIFWHVFVQPMTNVDASSVSAVVELEYTAKLMEPRDVTQS